MACSSRAMLLSLLAASITWRLTSSAKLVTQAHMTRTKSTHLSNTSHVKMLGGSNAHIAYYLDEFQDAMDFDPMGPLGGCFGCVDTDRHDLAHGRKLVLASGGPHKHDDHDTHEAVEEAANPWEHAADEEHADDHDTHEEHSDDHGADEEHSDDHGAHEEHVTDHDTHEEHSDDHGLHTTHGHPWRKPDSHGEEGHGEEGHGEEGHAVDGHAIHHHGEKSDPATALVSMMLFGCVSWVVSMFYFVNFPDEQIQDYTWSALSTMIAIFCAVLMFSASTEMLVGFAGYHVHHHGEPLDQTMFVGWTRWIILTGMLHSGFILLRNKPYKLKVFAELGGHLVGFGAIDAFGVTLHFRVFSSTWFGSFMGVLLAMAVLMGSNLLFRAFRLWLCRDAEFSSEEEEEDWNETCIESVGDSLGLSIGLLWSMLIRYAITGNLPAVHGDPQYKTTQQVWTLLVAAVLLAPVMVFTCVVKDILEEKRVHHHILWFCEVMYSSIQMTMGWTLLYWGYWAYYDYMLDQTGTGGKVGMRITMTFLFSALSFAAIISIDQIADRAPHASIESAIRSFLKTFAVLMGLSWESTFGTAVKAIGHQFEGECVTLVSVSLVIVICAVVLPAWVLFIKPKTLNEEGRVKKDKDAVEFKQRWSKTKDIPDVVIESA